MTRVREKDGAVGWCARVGRGGGRAGGGEPLTPPPRLTRFKMMKTILGMSSSTLPSSSREKTLLTSTHALIGLISAIAVIDIEKILIWLPLIHIMKPCMKMFRPGPYAISIARFCFISVSLIIASGVFAAGASVIDPASYPGGSGRFCRACVSDMRSYCHFLRGIVLRP